MTNTMVSIAVIIAFIGKILVDKGIVDPDAASQIIEGAWNRAVETFDPPPSIPSRVEVLDIGRAAGWVKYGVCGCAILKFAVCVAEGGGL